MTETKKNTVRKATAVPRTKKKKPSQDDLAWSPQGNDHGKGDHWVRDDVQWNSPGGGYGRARTAWQGDVHDDGDILSSDKALRDSVFAAQNAAGNKETGGVVLEVEMVDGSKNTDVHELQSAAKVPEAMYELPKDIEVTYTAKYEENIYGEDITNDINANDGPLAIYVKTHNMANTSQIKSVTNVATWHTHPSGKASNQYPSLTIHQIPSDETMVTSGAQANRPVYTITEDHIFRTYVSNPEVEESSQRKAATVLLYCKKWK